MTSCQSGIVSIALSSTIFEISDVEEYSDLEIYVMGHSPCEFMPIGTLLKFTDPGFCH